jgi:hypothetical protein
MEIKLPYGYTFAIHFSVRLTPPPVYYLYMLEDGHYLPPVGKSDSAEDLMVLAKRLLCKRYGTVKVWTYENDRQLVHPNSPTPKGAGHPVDALISTHRDLYQKNKAEEK